MGIILDKLALLFLCVIAFSFSDSALISVAGLLLLLIVSSLAEVTREFRYSCLFPLAYGCGCIFLPELACGAPLILYDCLRMKKWWAALPLCTAVFRLEHFGNIQIFVILAGVFVAAVFYLRVFRLEEQVGSLRSMRDEVTEKNLELDDRNRELADAQDNEVRIATLRERNRIAREIHDNVGHMLTRSLLQSGALIVINKDENMKEPLEELRSTLDSAMTSIRQSVHDLHDDSLDLKKIIEDSASAADERFTVSLDYDIGSDAPAKVKLCIAGIVKEGISNAIKHSSGDKLDISVREHPAFYQLLIMDNGSSDRINETGIGLKSMKERAEGVGGFISFTPSEEGFRVFASIPKIKENI
ncbi:MAG: histidine kinase [Ruminococcus sp.]|nr:histidine kinase [Ruminococcus sp.]